MFNGNCGEAMVDENQTEFSVGLSDEEKEDLENLIKAYRDEQFLFSPDADLEDIQRQFEILTEQIARISEIMLRFDKRMKSFYEIIRLSTQKNESMNERNLPRCGEATRKVRFSKSCVKNACVRSCASSSE